MASDHEVRFLRREIHGLSSVMGELVKVLKAQRSREVRVENYIKSLTPEVSTLSEDVTQGGVFDKESPRLHLVCTTCYTEQCLNSMLVFSEDCECCKNSHSPNKIKDQI